MFLLGVLIIPIASMGFMGIKAPSSGVLSAQDSKVKDLKIEELERENEYLKMEVEGLQNSLYKDQITNSAPVQTNTTVAPNATVKSIAPSEQTAPVISD